MSQKKKPDKRTTKRKIKAQIREHVEKAFPGCTADFLGQQSGAALVERTFGFRVRDQWGRYRSNIIWVNPLYDGEFNESWARWAVDQSNG